MLNAKEFLAWQRRLRCELPQEEVERAIRSVPTHYVGDSMKFAGGLPTNTGQNTDRGPSPLIWDNFSWTECRNNPAKGSIFYDDFLHFGVGTLTASNVGYYTSGEGAYKSYETTSTTIKNSNAFLPGDKTKANGVIELTSTAAADSQVALEAGDGNGGSWGLTGNGYPKLAFECRVYVNMTTILNYNLFFGLAEKGLAVVVGTGSVFSAATPAVINQKSILGFNALSAAPANILPIYGKNAVAAVNPTNGFNSGVGTLVAKTWTKLGFLYDPNPHDPSNGILKWYQDGKLLAYLTDCTVTAFPNSALLTPLINVGSNHAGTTAIVVDVDWIAVGCQVDA